MEARPLSTSRVVCAAVLAVTFGLGFGSFVLDGFSSEPLLRVLQAIAVFGVGIAIVLGAVALAVVRLGGWRQDEREFEQIVNRAQRLADDYDEDGWQEGWLEAEDFENASDEHEFDEVLRAAIAGLPAEDHAALEHVELAVVDLDGPVVPRLPRGRHDRYGGYDRSPADGQLFSERVVIFRDLLLRDFGHDPRQLRNRLTRLLRRELGRRPRPQRGLRHG
jgi:hypothetical protein